MKTDAENTHLVNIGTMIQDMENKMLGREYTSVWAIYSYWLELISFLLCFLLRSRLCCLTGSMPVPLLRK